MGLTVSEAMGDLFDVRRVKIRVTTSKTIVHDMITSDPIEHRVWVPVEHDGCQSVVMHGMSCLLYTSDAADE